MEAQRQVAVEVGLDAIAIDMDGQASRAGGLPASSERRRWPTCSCTKARELPELAEPRIGRIDAASPSMARSNASSAEPVTTWPRSILASTIMALTPPSPSRSNSESR